MSSTWTIDRLLRPIIALAGWLFLLPGIYVALGSVGRAIEDYSYQWEVIEKLHLGTTSLQEVQQTLGNPELTFARVMRGARYTVVCYPPRDGWSDAAPIYLYFDKASRLRYIDAYGYTHDISHAKFVGVLACSAIGATLLLMWAGLVTQRERRTFWLWLAFIFLGAFHLTVGAYLGAHVHYAVSFVVLVAMLVVGVRGVVATVDLMIWKARRRADSAPASIVDRV